MQNILGIYYIFWIGGKLVLKLWKYEKYIERLVEPSQDKSVA